MSLVWANPKNELGGTNYGKPWDKEYVHLVRAYKSHKCSECGIRIKPKDLYYLDRFQKKVMSKSKGESYTKWWSTKICLTCWKGTNELIEQMKALHSLGDADAV